MKKVTILSENQAQSAQALADISHLVLYAFATYSNKHIYACVVITTKPVHRLQIRPIVHKQRAPLPFPNLHPGPCSSVRMRRGTDRHTDSRDQYTFCLGNASCEM